MKELKILLLLIVIIGVIYWGVEPLAHSVMHPAAKPVDFEFKDLSDIDLSKGDPSRGKDLVLTNCSACHGVSVDGINPPMDPGSAGSAFGVVPPDLSKSGSVFDGKFLVHFILDPVVATHLSHKFKISCEGLGSDEMQECEQSNQDKSDYPMNAFKGILSQEDVVDIVSYLQSIAPSNISGKDVFAQACQRCHGIKYDGLESLTPHSDLHRYLGTDVPDLSMMIRSKGEKFLATFLNNPQNKLLGTVMPRVGLNKSSQDKVIEYMQSIGDSKKSQRENLGIKIMGFFIILSILAYAWKLKIWRDLH